MKHVLNFLLFCFIALLCSGVAVFAIQWYMSDDDVTVCDHVIVTDEAVAATCTETGLTEGSHCSVCGEVLVAQETIAASGHTVVTDEAVAATCTETGLTEGSHCSVCGEVLVAQETIAASGHTVVTDEAVAATCTATGLTEGSHCSVCGEVLVAQETIAASGHTVVTDEAVAATCTATGLTEGSHCSVCGEVLVVQETIAALGHSAADAVTENYVEATSDADGSYDSVVYCSVCGTEISRETITVKYESATTALTVTPTTYDLGTFTVYDNGSPLVLYLSSATSFSNIAQVTGGTGEYTLSGNVYATIDSNGYISLSLPFGAVVVDNDSGTLDLVDDDIVITDSNGNTVTLSLASDWSFFGGGVIDTT